MNGNTPYAGRQDVTEAGKRMHGDAPELSPTQRRQLSEGIASIASRTRELLPGEYAVGSEISAGVNGPRATVAVRPPVGNPVSAGFEVDLDAEELIASEDRDEVARGLAASAALQVKQAIPDEEFKPTAR